MRLQVRSLSGPSSVLLLEDSGKLISPGPWPAGLRSAAVLLWVHPTWAQLCSCDSCHPTQPVLAGWVPPAASLSGWGGQGTTMVPL